MTVRRAWLGLLLPAILSASTPASGGEPLTTRQLQALGARGADRVFRRDLLSILQPAGRIDRETLRRLRHAVLQTRPYGTEYAGLCRMDWLILRYAAAGDAARPEDTPLAPYGIESQPLFHAVRPPKLARASLREDETVDQTACAHLTGDDVRWFSAPNDTAAAQGLVLFTRALTEVRTGKLKPLPCRESIAPEKSCEAAAIAAGGMGDIDSVAACPAKPDELCYTIEARSFIRLTITAIRGGEDVAPTAITSIAVEEFIIVT